MNFLTVVIARRRRLPAVFQITLHEGLGRGEIHRRRAAERLLKQTATDDEIADIHLGGQLQLPGFQTMNGPFHGLLRRSRFPFIEKSSVTV